MIIESIEYISGSPDLKRCPTTDLPEFAFIGRSNVGKSSLINLLSGRQGLARVSGTPGKTRLINHFKVRSKSGDSSATEWLLVDLPGYGYARLSKTEREQFESRVKNYLLRRENLAITFLLIDSRIPPQAKDQEFIRWLGDHDIAFVLVFTKTDKPSVKLLHETTSAWKKLLGEEWEELPMIVMTSSTRGTGKEALLDSIAHALREIAGPTM